MKSIDFVRFNIRRQELQMKNGISFMLLIIFFLGQIRKQMLLKHIQTGWASMLLQIQHWMLNTDENISWCLSRIASKLQFFVWKCNIYTHLIHSTIDLWLRKHFRFNLISRPLTIDGEKYFVLKQWTNLFHQMNNASVCLCAGNRPRMRRQREMRHASTHERVEWNE